MICLCELEGTPLIMSNLGETAGSISSRSSLPKLQFSHIKINQYSMDTSTLTDAQHQGLFTTKSSFQTPLALLSDVVLKL